MRPAFLASILSALVIGITNPASADDCLDASDEARSLLAKRKLLDARAKLRVCAASICDESVRNLCDERLGEVSARLPTVIVDVKDRQGHDLGDVSLTIDGDVHSERVGTEITLDPGPHVFAFKLAGEEPVERSFVLVEREKGRREHVVIGRARAEPNATQPANANVASTMTLTHDVPPSARRWRTAGWIAIGASAVGIGIGSAFGILAITKNDAANCDASNVCDDPRARSDARTAADVSTASFVTGIVLGAVGLGILLFGPTAASPPTSNARIVK